MSWVKNFAYNDDVGMDEEDSGSGSGSGSADQQKTTKASE